MTEEKHRRSIRNFLLDPRFQLKYTLMVVMVTLLVATVLGYIAYDYSSSRAQISTLEKLEFDIAAGRDISEKLAIDLDRTVASHQRAVLGAIVGGVLLLTIALGITGIVITHRVVGPAYRLRRMFDVLRDGQFKVSGTIRDGDELQEVFESFQEMVESLRVMRQEEIQQLDEAIAYAKQAGVPERTIQDMQKLRERVQRSLA